jgi:hypothetical protein
LHAATKVEMVLFKVRSEEGSAAAEKLLLQERLRMVPEAANYQQMTGRKSSGTDIVSFSFI